MKVLKFGGTSVGTPESLRNVKSIVESQSEPCVVTVSALGGLTDRLIATAEAAAGGDDSYAESHELICRRHRNMCEAVIAAERLDAAWNAVSALLDELATIFKAIYLLRELTERSKDLVVSYGERMSCIIVTAMLHSDKCDALLAHSLDFMRTKKKLGKNVLDQAKTSALIAEKFAELSHAKIIVVPGFIAKDEEGRISNLGRGGSDYTAAIIAAELDAKVLEIWTDVDGFMSADPRVVKAAQIIDRLSFVEAMELCNFGAKVVYPPTIYPVFHKNIPIIIKNTFNPTAPGTLIAEGKAESTGAIGVSAIADTRLLRVRGGNKAHYDRMVNLLTSHGFETLMPNGSDSCGVRGSDANRAAEILREDFAEELLKGDIKAIDLSDKLATIAVVGHDDDTPGRMISALNGQGIPVVHAPQQAAPGTVACMVDAENLNDALCVIHSSFIENDHDL